MILYARGPRSPGPGGARYVTAIVNGDTGKTPAMVPHRSSAALSAFFAQQGRRWCRQVKVVVTDGSRAYKAAIDAHLGHARHVLDRFHVVRWFAAGLTQVRRDVQRREPRGVKPAFDPEVFSARFVLLRRGDTLTDADTDYMSCRTSWIDAIALSRDVAGTSYDAIHIDYNWRARIAVGAAVTSVIVANTMYNRMHDCLDDHGFDPDVRDWDAIWQKLHCHVYYQVGGGATWDLEGHRRSNWVGYLGLHNGCNQ